MRGLGRRFPVLAILAALLGSPAVAHAGMPNITLTDIARARLDTISFFLVAFLVCAFLVKLLWNYLAKDFPRMPRMTYRKALAATFLWGLVFLLVLTMISGARELLTPGAWKKDGVTYRLSEGQK
ncbi:MAG TPA: hypothetical protein VEN81_05435 [Planctomycetota bacterium]|nr:hypothetical protein [Planctomycetota bacterium]